MRSSELLKLATGYWASQALLTGTRLGLFDRLFPLLRIHHDRFADWAKLIQVVKRGRPVSAPGLFLKPTARTKRFIIAMEAMAHHVANSLLRAVDLSAYRHLLDVGGGSGAYSSVSARPIRIFGPRFLIFRGP